MSHDPVASAEIFGTAGNKSGPKRRIGLLGGTFDPPHLGHLIAADEVRWRRSLDEVWLVVANDPWQKSDSRQVTSATDRLEMVKAAVHGLPGLVASDIELQLGGASYTASTLRSLGDLYPNTEFEVIVGSDAAAGLETWSEPDWLAEHAQFVSVRRAGQVGHAPERFHVTEVQMPQLEISSTDLRDRFARGAPVRLLVPEAVCSIVHSKGLYSSHS